MTVRYRDRRRARDRQYFTFSGVPPREQASASLGGDAASRTADGAFPHPLSDRESLRDESDTEQRLFDNGIRKQPLTSSPPRLLDDLAD